jgi:pimeloyl-ACP methyl ester carboxylesterase
VSLRGFAAIAWLCRLTFSREIYQFYQSRCIMSNISIGNLNDNYFSIDFAGKTDPTDTYRFNRLNTGSFRVTAEGFSSIVGMQLLDSQGKVVKDIETNGTNSGTFSIDNLGATNYALKISAPSGDTNYQVSLTPDGKVDPLTGLGVDSGFFATDSTGQVGFDWLHDGGNYKGEVAIFSVLGMEKFTPGSQEFIKEAARRSLTNSTFGHVVISDPTEGANPLFNGRLGEGNYNEGQYSGPKTFAMKPGEAFAVMLVPNGTVQDVFKNSGAGGDKRPLLSLSSTNPDDAWLYGQVADVTGSGKAFAMEDQRVDRGSDKDYNDWVFNLTGATGKAVSIDKVIDPNKDWTKLDGGKKLIDYVKSKQAVVEPPVAVGPPIETKPPVAVAPPVEMPPVETKPPVAVAPPVEMPPIETKPPVAVAPPVETPPIETKPPVAVAPPVETPPVETTPPVAVAPPVERPPIETKPPVAVAPPVEKPPVETKPPVAVAPPVETKLPVAVAPPIETTPSVATLPVATTPPVATLPIAPPIPPVQPPTIAPEPPLVGLGPIDDLSQPIDPERPIETVLPISSPPENRAFIGIIDTGFATNNPDLDYSKVTLGRDRIDKDSNPLFTAGSGNEHGTFSWGLVSAIQGNDKGIDGYNDKANVYLSRAIGSGEWDLALTDFVGEAKAQKQKNAIALLPLDLTQKNADGSITTRYEFTPRERAALENARQNGVLLVVAAGNDGGVMSVLGQSSQEFENILTVGSSDGFGRSDYSSYGYGLDILVPGGAIDNPTLSTVGDDLGTMSGTSASAAKAAGMASKVWENNPDLNPTQVIDILTGSAIDLKEPGWDEETGFGVVNLNKAVQLAKETAPQAYIPTPFSNPTTWGLEGLVTPLERATADQFNGKYYDWESYTIQSGDTLSQIAVDTMGDASPDAYNFIAQHNNIPNPDEIYAGQEIQIPTEVSAPQQQPPTNDNPNVDFNPDNPNVDFNPDNPNVDFNPDNPNVDFNPDNPNVDFNPDNPNVDFNPDDNPNVDFNPDDNPNVDFNPDDNPNVDFNQPQSNSINLNGYTIGGNFYPVFQNYQGTLGNPTSDVINYNGVSYQTFDKGSIVSSANGTFPLYGGIRQEFLKTGGLNGRLGAPTSEEKGLGDGNIIQYFENGHIYWNGSKAIAYQKGKEALTVHKPSNTPIKEGPIGVAGIQVTPLQNFVDKSTTFKSNYQNLLGGSYQVTLRNYQSNYLEDKPTWVVVHGLGHSPQSVRDQYLPQQLKASGFQVLEVDWSSITKGIPLPQSVSSYIPDVGKFVADTLRELNVFSDQNIAKNINFVGQSFGSYVSWEAAKKLNGINRLVALDPANGLGALGGYNTGSVNFSDYTDYSWAFKSSWMGNKETATTADESFEINYDGSPENDHNDVIGFFASLIRRNREKKAGYISQNFELQDMSYSAYRPWNRITGYEGKITIKKENVPDNQYKWVPEKIDYGSNTSDTKGSMIESI